MLLIHVLNISRMEMFLAGSLEVITVPDRRPLFFEYHA